MVLRHNVTQHEDAHATVGVEGKDLMYIYAHILSEGTIGAGSLLTSTSYYIHLYLPREAGIRPESCMDIQGIIHGGACMKARSRSRVSGPANISDRGYFKRVPILQHIRRAARSEHQEVRVYMTLLGTWFTLPFLS